MLQIISGKFYGSNERYSTLSRGILYSNFAWGNTIETKVVKIDPVEVYGPISSYLITYNNEIEKESHFTGLSLVKVGDYEIIKQFKLLSSFGLRAYFDNENTTVRVLCRKEKLHNRDDVIPSTFTRRFLDNGIMGTQKDVDIFVEFFNKAIGLKRETYKKIISCISAFDTALRVLDQDISLAYSIMIYSLETLSQSFDGYHATWADYDQNQRIKLEKCFEGLSPEQASEIKNILITDAHLKLSKRFVEFTKKFITDDFYIEEAKKIPLAIKRTDIDRLLINAYNTRSGYVHNLRPLIKQISIDNIANGDVLVWDNQPYLTFAGLSRVTHHVIYNFIMQQQIVEKEDYNWRNDLPGMVDFKLAPQYWIWKHEGIRQEHATDKFEALLGQLISEPCEVTDIRELLKKYEQLIPQSKQKYKIQMFCTYLLYNSLIAQESRVEGYEAFIEKYEDCFDTCCIETMITLILLGTKWTWESRVCEETINAYLKSRYQKDGLRVPSKLELVMFLVLANSYLENEMLDKFEYWLRNALFDCPAQEELQEKIISAMKSRTSIDVNDVLLNRKSKKELTDN